MRKVIAIEGKDYGLRTIVPGALKFPENRVPVVFGFAYENLLGWATDFVRDENTGEISAEIDLFPYVLHPTEDEEKFYEWTINAGQLLEDRENNLVLSARIRMVAIIPIPGFPKSVLPKEMVNDSSKTGNSVELPVAGEE